MKGSILRVLILDLRSLRHAALETLGSRDGIPRRRRELHHQSYEELSNVVSSGPIARRE